MTGIVTTAWVLPPKDITGQDHLAVRAISEAIYAELVPCVTNVTDRIRLYAFYPWFTWTFGRKKPAADYDEFVRLFRRAECLLTMIGARHEMLNEESPLALHGEGLPGRRKLLGPARELNGTTVLLSTFAAPDAPEADRYFKAELGGLDQYYRGTLQTLDVMGGNRQAGMKVTPGRGVRLAQVFDASVPGDLFWKTIQKDEVSSDRLDALAAFCPCHLEGLQDERHALADVLLNRDHAPDMPDMQDALRVVCDFLADLDGSIENRDEVVWRFRESVYGGVLATGTWKDPALPKWAGYQRHELLSIAAQSLFWAVFRHVADTNDEGRLPVLHSSTEMARWFLGRTETQLSELNLGQPFQSLVDDVDASLPMVGAIDDGAHELAMARELMEEEEIPGGVVKSCRLLAALVARLSDEPPYGGFKREESYFRDYPLNLRSLRSLSKGRWQDLTVREWLLWLITHWAVGHHLRVALRKLHAQGLDTFRLRPTDLGLLPVQNLEVVYSSPRLTQTLRALRDLGFIDDAHRLTKRGLELKKELHG